MGLKEVPSGTAANYFEAGVETLNDIYRSCGDKKSDQLLLNMANTMNYRYIVSKAETQLWNDARTEAAERMSTQVEPLEVFFALYTLYSNSLRFQIRH